MSTSNANIAAPGVSFFTPAQSPPAGTALEHADQAALPTLFQPIKIRGVEFPNRIWLSPMCQYSAKDGRPTSWHLAHLGGIILRGPGLAVMEATAVLPEGRISPEDLGLWSDSHIESYLPLVEFAHSQNQKIGIQLNHAGRKASTVAPWITGAHVASEAVGGWPDNVWAPSTVPYSSSYPQPKALTKEGIQEVVKAFAEAAKRAVKAGFDVIEIHGAHGYLLNQFHSPVSNKRTDEYGGSFENRVRLSLEVVDAVRAVIPEDMPLLYRISATDALEEVFPDEPTWRTEETVCLASILFQHGVDFLDVSTSGNHPQQKIKVGPAYQAPFAQAVKESLDPNQQPQLVVGSVGAITSGTIAQGVLDKGQADVVTVGRQFLKDPATVWTFAQDLGVDIALASQMGWVFRGRARKPKVDKN